MLRIDYAGGHSLPSVQGEMSQFIGTLRVETRELILVYSHEQF